MLYILKGNHENPEPGLKILRLRGETIVCWKSVQPRARVRPMAERSVRNRPVRPGLLRTGTDGKKPFVLEQDGDGAVFLRLDGDGRKGRPSTEKS
jgi:hypothetical protein